jgi:hypothetical protein
MIMSWSGFAVVAIRIQLQLMLTGFKKLEMELVEASGATPTMVSVTIVQILTHRIMPVLWRSAQA